MTGYTRINVAGSVRRAEVVVPDAEPLGGVLPQLMSMLAEPKSALATPFTLIGVDGTEIDITKTPLELRIAEGSVLRLAQLDVAPPPPVIIDVADAIADSFPERKDLWSDRSRIAIAAVAIAVTCGLIAATLPLLGIAQAWTSTALLVAASLGAFTCGVMKATAANTILTGAAIGFAVPAVASWVTLASHWDPFVMFTASLLGTLSIIVTVAVGAGRRSASALAGSAIGLVLALVQIVLLVAGIDPVQAVTIPAILGVLAIGVLPWIALTSSGLNELDARAHDQRRVTRQQAAGSIDAAYATLTWGLAAATAIVVIGAMRLVWTAELWPSLLALALCVTLALRTRSYPLVPAHILLWSAVMIIAITAASTWIAKPSWLGTAILITLAALVAVAALVRPRPHGRARLRGWGNLVEALAVVSLIPIALGVWHVYQDLLAMFTSGS